MTLRFDDQVVIVTGAGGKPGLGRAYARLLAQRGARVVVNDLGVGPDGRGSIRASAEAIADEIRDEGGQAIADTHSVATESGATAIVQAALDAWGRVDALINNAGVMHVAPLERLVEDDIRKMVDVHLFGTIWMCRAVLPHMKERGYGRIVNTASESVFGAGSASIYGAVKSGVLGLTRALAIEGAAFDVRVNALAPMAVTVAWHAVSHEGGQSPPPPDASGLSPERVAPTAAFLAHRDCPYVGKFIRSEAGRVWEAGYFETAGFEGRELTLEELARHQSEVVDRESAVLVCDPCESTFAHRMDDVRYVPENAR